MTTSVSYPPESEHFILMLGAAQIGEVFPECEDWDAVRALVDLDRTYAVVCHHTDCPRPLAWLTGVQVTDVGPLLTTPPGEPVIVLEGVLHTPYTNAFRPEHFRPRALVHGGRPIAMQALAH